MSNSTLLSVLDVNISFICETKTLLEQILAIYPRARNVHIICDISIALFHSTEPVIELMRPPNFQITDTKLEGRSGASSFMADRRMMTGEAYLCAAILKDDYLLRHQILCSMSYYLLSYKHFTPIHCVCFQMAKTTFVCIGKSGSGKSTIAISAMLRGYDVLAEDICFIGGSPVPTLNADCREIHVLFDSLQFFPELSESTLEVTHNGKLKCRVPIPNTEPRHVHEKIKVIFIDPDHSQPQSTSYECTDHSYYSELYSPIEEGFNLTSLSRKKNVDWLRKHPTYRIRTGNNLDNFFKVVGQLD